MMDLIHVAAAMTLPSEIVVLVIASIMSIQTAVAGWVLLGLIDIKGRLHELEAREANTAASILNLSNRMDEITADLLSHRKH